MLLEALTFDVADAPAAAAFWAALLDREVLMDSDGAFLPGSNTQLGLRFSPEPQGGLKPSASGMPNDVAGTG